jgi:hypothetical protein
MLSTRRLLICIIGLAVLPSTLVAQADSVPTIGQARVLLGQQQYEAAAEILRTITARQPENPRAWAMLGLALHAEGDYQAALAAHRKAAEFPQTAPNAMYNIGAAYARLGDKDQAFEWLEKARATNQVDMTQLGADPDAESLRGDPRYERLLPTAAEFDDPFVEPVEIIHEWRGEAASDQFGWIARNIGDVNGDGVNDVTTSAPTSNAGGQNAGRVYTYSGRDGTLLWTADGPVGGQLGLGIEAAGDVNADGIPDVIAGAPGAGKAFVFSGRDGAVLLTLSSDQPNTNFGRKVSDIGDLNGDGHADVLVGEPGRDDGTGRAYVFTGKDGSILAAWDGEVPGDNYGSAGAGLVSDGQTFVVVGAPNAGDHNRGRTYVYKGLAARPAFVIESDEQGQNLGGMFVSVIGDVNADGTPDVYASDWAHNANGPFTGRVYIHSGRNGERLRTFTGESAGDGFGIGPADAGDVNGDGCDDIVVGAWRHASAAPMGGKIYVYSGQDGSLLSTITGKVMGETLGFDATGMDDVNGDGVIDYLVTSAWSGVNGTRSGRMYIVSGQARP